ncbi:MAG: hypothetical protein PHE18_03295 [Candidatus Omnitrophica bacterium]|nr:hypothetical protein [Candidatus Omnitrophota bacterium]MDD5552881.1 hypothetical protein [Candidatus Omnitrophota bacterium]
MVKKIRFSVLLILFSALLSGSLSAESHSIRISCTIPQAAGVNTPIISEGNAAGIKNADSQNGKGAPIVFEKEKKETRQVEGAEQEIAVRTVYGR